MARAERFVLESKNLKDFVKEDFLKKVEVHGDIFPISLVFIAKEKINEDSLRLTPIVFSHKNDKEIASNILHVDSDDPILLEKIVKGLEKDE